MMELCKNMILYHGSYCCVENTDLQKCAAHKDFGCGFYLTTSLEQARSFARLTTRKAIANSIVDKKSNIGYVNRYIVVDENPKLYAYQTADADWLHCVVGHRKQGMFPCDVEAMKDYDVITGKIANDATKQSNHLAL